MIIGTPITGVIALIGMTPDDAGSTLMNVHNNAITAPHRAVAGNSVTWFDDCNASLAM